MTGRCGWRRAPWRLLWVLLCGCGAAATPAPGHAPPLRVAVDAPRAPAREGPRPEPGRPADAGERRVIEELAKAAARVRGLSFSHPVTVTVQGRDEIVAHLTDEMDDDELEKARTLYVALGLLPPDMDVRALIEGVLGEQVLGYYDHESGRLVVRDDVMRRLRQGGAEEARVTIVHELVHALQDQRLGLGEHLEDDERDTDPANAYQAVAEGDATLAMIGYLLQKTGGRLSGLTRHRQMLREMMSQGLRTMGQAQLAAAPAILRVTLLSSYMDGLLFAAALHARGGFRAVDEAHRRPPVSTEQVLHPGKYLSGELPDAVRIPPLPELAAAGLEVADEDTLGELEMGVYLGQRTDGVDEAAAAGWSGDRIRVFRDEAGGSVVVWFSAWDDETEAREAQAAAARVTAGCAGDGRDAAPGGAAGCDLRSVLRQGRGLLITRHLAPALRAPVVRAFRAWAGALPAAPPRIDP